MKRYLYVFVAFIYFLLSPNLSLASNTLDKEIEVNLWKKYEDSISMGDKALEHKARLLKSKEGYILRLKFLPLELNGQKGYLGGLEIKNKDVKVVSEYDVIDEFNHPQKGKDKKLKGKKYPKELEFVVDPKEEFIDACVYVPIMEELGSGNQEVRIKLNIDSKDYLKKENNIKKEKNEDFSPINLEEGKYKVDLKLFHWTEDKESMGNKALNRFGLLSIEKDNSFLYIETDKLEVQNINSSLVDLYYLDGDKYYKAEKGDYSLEIPNDPIKRPKIFKIPIKFKIDELNIMVDPKVSVMGDDPLKARLMINWDKVEKVNTGENDLENRFKIDRDYKVQDKGSKLDKGIFINYEAGTFDKEFDFYANKLSGKDIEEFKNLFSPLSTVEFYSIEFFEPLNEILVNEKNIKEKRKAIEAEKELEIEIPINSIKFEDKPKIYKLNKSKAEEIDYITKDKNFSFKGGSGKYAIVRKGAEPLVPINNINIKKPTKKIVNKAKIKNKVVSSKEKRKSIIDKGIGIKSSLSSSNNINEGPKLEKKVNLEIKENKAIIFTVALILILINVVSIIILKKNISVILELLDENKKLKEFIK
ncbi:MAG: hypothetical protein ACTHWZ_07705 [Peptoniphilaceae bacterium]